jgi:glycosyltransferase involved in cell wall biosynthesis
MVTLIAGRHGRCSDRLKQLRRSLGLDARVRFLGDRDDVADLLAAADLFVLPSLYEGASGALIEAMALEVPAVVSDLPALWETTGGGQAAVLVPAGSAGDLARAIRDLLDRPAQARAIGAEGRRLYLRRFTLDRSADGFSDLIRMVVAERAGGTPR